MGNLIQRLDSNKLLVTPDLGAKFLTTNETDEHGHIRIYPIAGIFRTKDKAYKAEQLVNGYTCYLDDKVKLMPEKCVERRIGLYTLCNTDIPATEKMLMTITNVRGYGEKQEDAKTEEVTEKTETTENTTESITTDMGDDNVSNTDNVHNGNSTESVNNNKAGFVTSIEMPSSGNEDKRLPVWETEIDNIKFKIERSSSGIISLVVNDSESFLLNDYISHTEDVAIEMIRQQLMITLSGLLNCPANDPKLGKITFQFTSNEYFRNLLHSFYAEKERTDVTVSEEVQKLTPTEEAIYTTTKAILNDVRKLESNGYVYYMRYFNKDFYAFNGKSWEKLDDDQVDRLIKEKAESLNVLKIVGRKIDEVKKTLGASLPGRIQYSENYIAFEDCVIDTREFFINGRLQCLQHSPEIPAIYHIQYSIMQNRALLDELRSHIVTEDFLNTLAQKYTPTAVRYFTELVNSDWSVLYKLIGYCLVSYGNPLNKFFILVGSGSNGKTKFTEFLANKVLGKHNVSTVALVDLVDPQSFKRYQLYNKLLNIDDDMPQRPLNIEELKRLTGDGVITADRKHKSPIEFRVTAKLLFNSNYYPSEWIGVDNALARRVWIIEFPNVFPENSTPKYPDESEIPNVLLLSMQYAKLVLQTGILYSGNSEKVQMLKTAVNQVQRFLEEMEKEGQIIRAEQDQRVEYRDLKLLYKLWVERYPLIKPLSDRAFINALRDLGYDVVNYHNGNYSSRIVRGLAKLRA